jgi:hypothetical protein
VKSEVFDAEPRVCRGTSVASQGRNWKRSQTFRAGNPAQRYFHAPIDRRAGRSGSGRGARMAKKPNQTRLPRPGHRLSELRSLPYSAIFRQVKSSFAKRAQVLAFEAPKTRCLWAESCPAESSQAWTESWFFHARERPMLSIIGSIANGLRIFDPTQTRQSGKIGLPTNDLMNPSRSIAGHRALDIARLARECTALRTRGPSQIPALQAVSLYRITKLVGTRSDCRSTTPLSSVTRDASGNSRSLAWRLYRCFR